jgi:hypothetical protein
MFAARALGGRMNLALWLGMGAVYGLLLFAIAQGLILPRTNSPLAIVPVWVFGFVHVLYGIVLAWLLGR